MNPERWARAQELFHAAQGLDEDERRELLSAACGDDAELRQLVEGMLDAPSPAGFVEPPSPERLLEHLRELSLDLEGAVFGDFELRARLGRGAMGVVFRARQVSLEREVAVKILAPTMEVDDLIVERFRREALAASRLKHPGIVPVLAAGEERGLCWYAMELVQGWSLRQLLRGEAELDLDPREPRTAAQLLAQVAAALAHSHEHGVLHRDVKPENILIDREQLRPRLIDFGLAKLVDLEALSQTGQAAGTPLYMSPEQVEAERGFVDQRTDVYSAGAVLYELLTGSPPFPGDSYHEVLHRITHAELVPVRQRAPRVPQALARICQQALERDRQHRYPDAGALADDLGRFLDGREVAARGPSLRRRAARKVTRRALLRAAPAAVAGAVIAGYWIKADQVAAAGERPARITVAGGRGRLTLAWSPLRADAPVVPQVLARGRGDQVTGRVPRGLGRMIVIDEHGASAEWIEFAGQEPIVRQVRLRAALDVDDGMVQVPGGLIEFEVFRDMRPARAQVPYAAFLMDEAAVTVADYRAFVEDTGADEPGSWEDATREDLDELPVTGVRLGAAIAYALWVGKRLPSAAEWIAAARGSRPCPPEWLDPELTPFRVGRPRGARGVGDVVIDAGYLAHAVPARDEGHPPHGLHHAFGNVHEMVEAPASDTGENWYQAGGAWYLPADVIVEHPLLPYRPDLSADRGFRCAKSLDPLSNPEKT